MPREGPPSVDAYVCRTKSVDEGSDLHSTSWTSALLRDNELSLIRDLTSVTPLTFKKTHRYDGDRLSCALLFDSGNSNPRTYAVEYASIHDQHRHALTARHLLNEMKSIPSNEGCGRHPTWSHGRCPVMELHSRQDGKLPR